MDRPLLTPEERGLLAEAERQAVAGMTFDAAAGLADLRRRARQAKPRSGPTAACRRAVPRPRQAERAATGKRLRPAVLAFVGAVLAVVVGGGAMARALDGNRGPVDEAVSPAAPPPFSAPGSPHLGVLVPFPADVVKSPRFSPLLGQAPSVPRAGSAAASAVMSAAPASATAVPSADPSTGPSPSPSPADSPSPSVAAETSATAVPSGTFGTIYESAELTVPATGEQSQAINLARPSLDDTDGDVVISSVDGGDLRLVALGSVRTGTIAGDTATATECADAIQDNPSGPSVELREDKTYCLLAGGPTPAGQTALVRLNVEPVPDTGQVTLRMAAWDATP
ncbi:hypothetical protein [Actinoplanes sp. HUAS TT8]|uniref:hypothetical protein n=1 Tax=Actinoplanes sp. HUAS TT8 TaxID=3447453 RepID=UPI003F51E753